VSDIGSRLRRVRWFREERRRHQRRRRREWLYAGIMVCMTLSSGILGLKLGLNDQVVSQFDGDGGVADRVPGGEGDVVFNSSGLKDVFRSRFSTLNETGWCVYGSIESDRYVVENVEWVGHYGESDTVSFSCNLARSDFLGRVHNHPNRDSARLSETDMSNFFDYPERRFSGVLVRDDEGWLVLRWFDRESLRSGFDVSSLGMFDGSAKAVS